jgi:hypothetical protein
MNRIEIAQHFHRLAAITREEIFGRDEPSSRPLNLPSDAATMFAGYVGKKFTPGRGIVILGINPGGGDAYLTRTAEDEAFYPILREFKTAQRQHVLTAFERVNDAFVKIVQAWNLWRILEPTLEAAGRDISEAAYMNVVPYRTRQDKVPPSEARRSAWYKVVAPTLTLLLPRAVITLGKKAGAIVDALAPRDLEIYCVPRTIGDTYISEGARAIHERLRASFRL